MSKFDDIRPYHDDEVKAVIQSLLTDTEFLDFLGKYHSPRLSQYAGPFVRIVTRYVLRRSLGKVGTIREFQEVISYYAKRIVTETMSQFVFEGLESLEAGKAYLFVGNHRDIAGDSMLVDYALWLSGHETVRIAVGDNLIQREFATSLMKLNKSFFIRRSEEGAKKVYAALLQSSQYIHESIREGASVWIAQSEGRAKNGLDVTDPAIIKMFALAERKASLRDVVQHLSIVPVSISYEYDPCDYLKAKELSAIDEYGEYRKPAGEDLLSLVKGLGEYKGKVYLRFGDLLKGDFDSPEEIANELDHQLLNNYQLYDVNYWALQQLAGNSAQDDGDYLSTWRALRGTVHLEDTGPFETRLANCPEPHRQKWLEMYANPVVNKYRSKSSRLAPI
ncbi:MAG: 1-acyl-sn-glycerol-3-phosphate acyltransferase [Candidatus Azotimanducaceae bacterium]|jgi:1-acyl-sn-glycerol-3-phosphate acyltransferase